MNLNSIKMIGLFRATFFCCRATGDRERFFAILQKKPGELSRGNNKEIPFVGVGVFIFCLLGLLKGCS